MIDNVQHVVALRLPWQRERHLSAGSAGLPRADGCSGKVGHRIRNGAAGTNRRDGEGGAAAVGENRRGQRCGNSVRGQQPAQELRRKYGEQQSTECERTKASDKRRLSQAFFSFLEPGPYDSQKNRDHCYRGPKYTFHP